MWIIVDKRIPAGAKEKLSRYGSLMEFESSGIVYDAISGHPDIFMCHTDTGLILAPDTPKVYFDFFTKQNIPFKTGKKILGKKYPATSHYNAVVSGKYLIHNLKYTDTAILDVCKQKIHLDTKQAYTRCNLLALDEHNFITSDRNIEKILLKQSLNVLFVCPGEILLPGFANGFFGGCCGVCQKKIYVIGSLTYLNSKNDVIGFIERCGFEVIELYDGKLFDAGGIFIINS
ncbi:MAG TPA: hypothetical protein PKH58_10905 [Paludibacteraceae bacterium]|nr:hypothetical protein [Paludibacteraceae bacterium]